MGMLNAATRGGQVMVHKARMGGQVVILLFLHIPKYTLLLVTPLYMYTTLKRDQIEAALLYGWVSLGSDTLGGFTSPREVLRLPFGRLEYEVVMIQTHPFFADSVGAILDAFLGGLFRALLIAICLSVALAVFFTYRGGDMAERRRLRGAELVTPRELIKAVLQSYGRIERYIHPPYSIAGIPYPKGAEGIHTLIVGSTGTGKTVAMKDIVAQIRARGDKAIIFDRMCAFIPPFYDKTRDTILNPYDVRSPSWDVFCEAQHPSDFHMMAASLMPHFKDTADPFWVTSARLLFATGASALYKQYLQRLEKQPDNRFIRRPDQNTLSELLIQFDLKRLARVLQGTEAQSIVDEKNSKTSQSVRAVLSANISALTEMRRDGEKFSIRDWVAEENDGGCFLFLSSRADIHDRVQVLIATWIEVAVRAILSLPQDPNRRIWFIFDELATLSQIPALRALLREGRQFGACAVLGVQAMSELRVIYGREEAQAISANCNSRLILNMPDRDTAEWLSSNLGREETEGMRQSFTIGQSEWRDSESLSTDSHLRPVVIPEDIMNLPALEGFLNFPHGLPIARLKLKPRNYPIIAKPLVEDFNLSDPSILSAATSSRDAVMAMPELAIRPDDVSQADINSMTQAVSHPTEPHFTDAGMRELDNHFGDVPIGDPPAHITAPDRERAWVKRDKPADKRQHPLPLDTAKEKTKPAPKPKAKPEATNALEAVIAGVPEPNNRNDDAESTAIDDL